MGMFRMIFLFGALALWLSVGTVFSAEQPSGNWTQLTKSDLSAWREPTGDWQGGGDVFVKSTSDTLFSSKPGAGVILNGSKGKTLNLISKIEHSDVEAHVEFMIPKGSNSGVYLMGRYEIQVLDCYNNKTYPNGQCGAFYGHNPPLVNACRPPGQWQTYDIIFHAPKQLASGQIQPGSFTILHNGVLIQDHIPVGGEPTTAAPLNGIAEKGPLYLQDHGNPVRFRNVWIRRL